MSRKIREISVIENDIKEAKECLGNASNRMGQVMICHDLEQELGIANKLKAKEGNK